MESLEQDLAAPAPINGKDGPTFLDHNGAPACHNEGAELEEITKIKNDTVTTARDPKIEEAEGTIKMLHSEIVSFQQQKAGLVEELNQMNVVLKQRGELITKMEEDGRIQACEFQATVEELKRSLAEKEQRIEQLVGEVNRCDERSEVMSTSTVSRAEEMHRLKDVEDSLEDRYNKLKSLAVRMKKKMAEQTLELSEKSTKLAAALAREKAGGVHISSQALQKDIDRLNDALEAKASEEAVLKKDLSACVLELGKCRESVEEHKSQAATLRQSTELLENNQRELERLQKELKEQLEASSREVEVERILRQEQTAECKRLADERRAEAEAVEGLRAELQASLLERQELQERERALLRQSEERSGQLDDWRLQLSLANGELQKERQVSALRIDSLQKQTASLDALLAAERRQRADVELRLQHLNQEFEGYKVRATSVLKKKLKSSEEASQEGANPAAAVEDEDSTDLGTDQVERRMLQRVVDALQTKVAEFESQVALLQNEVLALRADKERLASGAARNVQALEQRILHASQEMEDARRDHEALVERLHVERQLLESLHHEQAEAARLRHAGEVAALQSQVDGAASEIGRLQVLLASLAPPPAAQTLRPGASTPPSARSTRTTPGEAARKDSFEVATTERRPSPQRPIPLEDLLNGVALVDDPPVDNEAAPAAAAAAAAATAAAAAVVERLKEQLAASEKKCRHLGALLAESEASEARLAQLSDALKEDIRRSQRAEERQKHAENLEYLKNVILKFLTLERGEERGRLVPVVSTLLRLSPAEVQQLGRVMDAPGRSSSSNVFGGVFNHLWTSPNS